MAGEPRVSKIHLDEATRARIVKELKLTGGLKAVPEEIVIEAVEPKEKGDVQGYLATGGFVNARVTTAPTLATPKLAVTGKAFKVWVDA
jgi:hypothetical protein